MKENDLKRRMKVLLFASTLLCFGCRQIPSGVSAAPKIVEADGTQYTACEGLINVYQPSREVADSSARIYEITFTDE
jgi:hypothetical protein